MIGWLFVFCWMDAPKFVQLFWKKLNIDSRARVWGSNPGFTTCQLYNLKQVGESINASVFLNFKVNVIKVIYLLCKAVCLLFGELKELMYIKPLCRVASPSLPLLICLLAITINGHWSIFNIFLQTLLQWIIMCLAISHMCK